MRDSMSHVFLLRVGAVGDVGMRAVAARAPACAVYEARCGQGRARHERVAIAAVHGAGREGGAHAEIAALVAAVRVRVQAEGAVVVKVLNDDDLMLAQGIVDRAGEKRHGVVDVRNVMALSRQKLQERSPCGQRVKAAGEQAGLGYAREAVDHGIVDSKDSHPVPVSTQGTHFHPGRGIDATSLAHEVVADEDIHDGGARAAASSPPLDGIASPGARERKTCAGTPPTTEKGGTSLVTTAPAATTLSWPIVTPASTVLPAPSQQSSSTAINSRVTPWLLIGTSETSKLWFSASRLTRGPMSTLAPISMYPEQPIKE